MSTALNSRYFQNETQSDLPWGELGVDVVIESTGIFADKEKGSTSS